MIKKFIRNLFFKDLYKRMIETSGTQTPINLKIWIFQKIFGFNKEN